MKTIIHTFTKVSPIAVGSVIQKFADEHNAVPISICAVGGPNHSDYYYIVIFNIINN